MSPVYPDKHCPPCKHALLMHLSNPMTWNNKGMDDMTCIGDVTFMVERTEFTEDEETTSFE
jgi:hypothetical protein